MRRWAIGLLAAVAIPAGPGVAQEVLEVLPGDDAARTLEACVQAAIRSNGDLRRERQRRGELTGQGWQAMSTALPSLDVTGTWSRSRDPSFLLDASFSGTGAAPSGGLSPGASAILDELAPLFSLPQPDALPAQTFWRSDLSSDWELNPFRIVNALSGVKIRLEQHEADLEAATHRIEEETIRTFHEVTLHHERLAAVEAEIEAREEFLDITRRRFELEMSTELDTLQAAVSLANLRPESRRTRKDLRNAAARLNLLMGREPASPLTILPAVDVETAPFPEEEARALVERRADLRSLELQTDFVRKQRGVERAQQRPALKLSGAYGYVARNVGDLGDIDYWRADISLVVPLFDGFLTKGRVEELNGTLAQARTRLDDARRQARLDVATEIEERDAARESWEAARLTLTAADRALETTKLRYELGQAEYLDLLNSQAQRFDARRNLIQARYDLLAATAALKRSVGADPLLPLSRVREPSTGDTR